MERRRYLKVAGVVGAVGLAGCSGGGGESTTESGGTTTSGGSTTTSGGSTATSGSSGYPSRSIHDIVPYGEGGGTDTWQREVMPVLSDEVGVDINIENVTGAGGTRGVGVFLNQSKDAYNLLAHNIAIMPSAVLTTRPPFANKLPELTPLYGYGYNANMIIAKKGLATDFEEFLKKLKTDEINTIATPGPGSLGEIIFKTMSIKDAYPVSSDDWKSVPYDSGAAVGRAVLNGETDAGCTAATALVRQYDGSNFQPIVSVSSQGVSAMPDLQTVVDAGYPNIDTVGQNTRCQWLPPGTSQDKVDTLAEAMSNVVDSKEVQQWSKKTGNPTTHIGPDDLEKLFVDSMKLLPDLLDKKSFKDWPKSDGSQ
ncbi:MAG: Bug family tripartite tricarboxylate transporter substrate binding protein [Haloferacaceae archaeon]